MTVKRMLLKMKVKAENVVQLIEHIANSDTHDTKYFKNVMKDK